MSLAGIIDLIAEYELVVGLAGGIITVISALWFIRKTAWYQKLGHNDRADMRATLLRIEIAEAKIDTNAAMIPHVLLAVGELKQLCDERLPRRGDVASGDTCG